MMTLQPCERVLVDGGRRELLEFGSCKHCVVVDWRDDVETILGEVRRMLPEGYLVYHRVGERTWELQCQGTVCRLLAPEGGDTEPLLRSINRALLPEYEMRIFTPTMGDGYSLLVRPAKWWSDFSAVHGSRARKLFATADDRVEFTRTDPSAQGRPPSWWKRLFGA